MNKESKCDKVKVGTVQNNHVHELHGRAPGLVKEVGNAEKLVSFEE